jgi:hypothetical protein
MKEEYVEVVEYSRPQYHGELIAHRRNMIVIYWNK